MYKLCTIRGPPSVEVGLLLRLILTDISFRMDFSVLPPFSFFLEGGRARRGGKTKREKEEEKKEGAWNRILEPIARLEGHVARSICRHAAPFHGMRRSCCRSNTTTVDWKLAFFFWFPRPSSKEIEPKRRTGGDCT